MSRPESAAGSNPGLTHAVKPLPQRRSLSPSNIALFVANLRLLNLDQRSDWPDITVTTFDTKDVHQNAKKRISCVEWSLYRLFELWDRETTRDKLQPFFPPLEPLQSLNLRAALFRCLNELKKSDVLGREAILRKTMLDDCKGDKFEEILLLFSFAVVKKHALSSRHKKSFPIGKNLAVARNINKDDLRNFTPLTLAYRASLSKTLGTRADLDLALENFRKMLYERQEVYQRRHLDLQQSTKHSILPETSASLRHDLRQNWVGGGDGCEALLSGGKTATSDAYLDSDYDTLWQHVRQGVEPTAAPESVSLLENLQIRVADQQKRLSRWRDYRNRSDKSNEASISTTKMLNNTDNDTLTTLAFGIFTKHKDIRMKQDSSEVSSDSTSQDIQYGDMVMEMIQALSRVGKDKQTRRTSHVPRSKQASIINTPRARAGAERVPVPVFLSKSKGLENDFFSPLKRPLTESDEPTPYISRDQKLYQNAALARKHSDSATPISQMHLPRQHARHTPLRIQSFPVTDRSSLVDDSIPVRTPQKSASYQPLSAESSSSLGEVLGQMQLSDVPTQTEEDSTQPRDDATYPSKEPTQFANDLVEDPLSPALSEQAFLPIPHNPNPPQPEEKPTRPSLSERARMSMAFRSNEAIHTISALPSPLIETSTPNFQNSHGSSLADRARQSISLASLPAPSSETREPSKRDHLQVQEFATPKKSNHANLNNIEGLTIETTPKDKLFEQDAEYASVFKSRPKIATSPMLSPALGEDTEMDFGEGEESAMNFGSSPLRNYGM